MHILPFADTLPTTYSFRLFEDYLQPFLKEQPWRLIRKGDIFSYRYVGALREASFHSGISAHGILLLLPYIYLRMHIYHI